MGVDQAIDITVAERRTVLALLERHLPGTEAWAYGSRAKWTSRPQSDLDLVVFATPEQRLQVGDLREAFEKSDLPFRVDLFVWDDVPESFRERIRTDHVVLMDTTLPDDGNYIETTADWQRHEVCDLILCGVLAVGDGYRARNDELADSGLPFARAGNVADGLRFSGTDRFPEDRLHKVGDKASRPGDVVFTSKGTVGRFAFVRKDTEYFVYSPQLCYWRSSDCEIIDPYFLYCWMRGPEFFHQFRSVAGQTDMAEYVSLIDQRRMFITLPPLTEQRAIAHVLGTLDDKIELNRRMNATLEAMARALFKSWFVDFDPVRAKMEGRDTGLPKDIADLFPDRLVDSDLGEIPEGWKAGHVEDEFEIIMGQSPPGHTYNDAGDGLPFFQGRSDFGFRYPKNRKFCSVPNRIAQPWDTIVSVRAPVGDINMASERCCIGRGVAALRPRSGAVSFGYCTAQALQTHMREYEHTGTVFGAINRKQLAGLPLQRPTADVVHAFEHLAHPWDQTIRLRTAQGDILTALRDALLPKLVSGKLTVHFEDRVRTERFDG